MRMERGCQQNDGTFADGCPPPGHRAGGGPCRHGRYVARHHSHQQLLPPAKSCPVFASWESCPIFAAWTTQVRSRCASWLVRRPLPLPPRKQMATSAQYDSQVVPDTDVCKNTHRQRSPMRKQTRVGSRPLRAGKHARAVFGSAA